MGGHNVMPDLYGGPDRSDPLRILIVDHRVETRRLLAEAVGRTPGIIVVDEADEPDEALQRIDRTRPDVAVVECTASGADMAWCRQLSATEPTTRCLVTCAVADEDAVLSAIYAGAAGFVLEDTSTDDLIDAIRLVGRGDSVLDPAVTEAVLNRIRRMGGHRAQLGGPDRLSGLTPDQLRLLWLITDGLSNRQIADRLAYTEQVVKHHVSGLLAKLRMQRRSQVAAFGAQVRSSGEAPASLL
jgi:two-component system response regulator DevR